MALQSLLDTRQGRKVRTGLWNRNFDLGTRFKLRRVLFQSEGRTLNDEERRVVAFFVQHTQMAKTPYWTVLSKAQRARLADLVQLADVMASAESSSGAGESDETPEQGQKQDHGRSRAASSSSRPSSRSSRSERGKRAAKSPQSTAASACASAPCDFQRCVALYGAAALQSVEPAEAAGDDDAATSAVPPSTAMGMNNDRYIQLDASRLTRKVFIMVKGHGWGTNRSRARSIQSSSQGSSCDTAVTAGGSNDDVYAEGKDATRVALNPGDMFGALDVPGVQPSTTTERRALDEAARFSGGVVLEAGCQLLVFTTEHVRSIFEEARAARLNNRRLIRGKDWRDTLVANFFPDALRYDMLAPAMHTETTTTDYTTTDGGDSDTRLARNFFRNALPAQPQSSPSAATARSATPVTSPTSLATGIGNDSDATGCGSPSCGLEDGKVAAYVSGTPLDPLDKDALWKDVSVASSRAARGDPFAIRPPSQVRSRERSDDIDKDASWDVNAQRVNEAHERTSNIPFQLNLRDGTHGTFAMDFSTPAGSPELLRFETGVFQMMQGCGLSESS